MQTLGGRKLKLEDMMTQVIIIGLSALTFFLSGSTFCRADTAEVLPKGTTRIAVDSKFYRTITQRYDEDGNREDIASSFRGVLDSSVFEGLALVEQFFGMPPGSANVGNSLVDFDYDVTEVSISFQHGITDRVAFGIKIPWYDLKNEVDASLDTSNATVGKNATLGIFAPLGVPGTVPLTDEDVQDLLGQGLDINGDGTVDVPGFGYKRFDDWSDQGIGNIEGGLKWQFHEINDLRFALAGGVRVPTGETDDPDKLTDLRAASGNYAALFRYYTDYLGIPNVRLNATLSYDLNFPYRDLVRVASINEPITANKDRVRINRGDLFRAEVSGTYFLWESLGLSLMYRYGCTGKDKYTGYKGLNYSLLEEETKTQEHVYKATLAYSTVPLFRAKKFPVPLTGYVSYRNRFAGKDNAYRSQYIGAGVAVFF